ncbi:MAG: O-antigen ligase family protein [Victivallales bacterium]|nr:O-antigen ligase family protein [Victivallales bacterium]
MLSEYKYYIFFAVLLFGVPVGIILACMSRFWEKSVLFIAIFFTCRNEQAINFFSHRLYKGTSRGFEISIVDLAMVILFFVILFRKEFKLRLLPPGSLLYGLYFLLSMASIARADIQLYSWFEILKLVRMYFLFWVLSNYFNNYDRIILGIKFFGLVICYIFAITILQRYFLHMFQVRGTFPHQNSLAMYCSVLGPLFLALAINYHGDKPRLIYFSIMTFAMCSAMEIMTLSRGGLACYLFGVMTSFGISCLTGMTSRKVIFTVLAVIVGSMLLGYAAPTIIRRFKYAPVTSRLYREQLAKAACNMANDSFFGVGLNNFGLKVNPPYQYFKEDKKIKHPEGYTEGLVESTYLMIAAETGWFNLAVYLLLLLRLYWINFRNIFRLRHRNEQFIAIGFAGGLSAIYLQSVLEWVLRQTDNAYQLMYILAVIVAMDTIYRREKRQAALSRDLSSHADPHSIAASDPALLPEATESRA